MKLRVVVSVLLLAVLAKAYSANTSGFPTLETVMDTDAAGQLTGFIFNSVRLWLFPSMNFSCSGNITEWIFQAESSDDGTELPRMQVWRENSISVDVLDYLLQSTSGSAGELSTVEESVYKYVLESPVPVEEGDILGISLPPATDRRLLLQFQDFGNLGAPESYLTPVISSTFLAVSQLGVNARFLPLVTAIIATVEVSPTPVSTPGVVSSTMPMATAASTATPPPDSKDTSSSGSSGQLPAGIAVAASAGILVIVLIVTGLVAVAIVLRKRKKLGYIPRDLELKENEAYGVAGTAGPRLENNPTYRAFGEAAFTEGEHDKESTVHNCEAVDDHQFGASGELQVNPRHPHSTLEQVGNPGYSDPVYHGPGESKPSMDPEQYRSRDRSSAQGEATTGDIGGHDRGLDRSTVHDYEMIDDPRFGVADESKPSYMNLEQNRREKSNLSAYAGFEEEIYSDPVYHGPGPAQPVELAADHEQAGKA